MKFGYVKTNDGSVKSVNLDKIRLVQIDTDSIIIRYETASAGLSGAAYFISFNNPSAKTSGTINQNFYAWLKDSLNALKTQRLLLNDYMVGFEIITAGISSTIDTFSVTFQPAVDSAAACLLSGGTAGIIDTKIGPAIGNLVLEGSSATDPDLKPIANGSYSLIVSGVKYFVTLVGSRISTIEVCPLILDFVFDPNQQAASTPDLPNYFTFAMGSYQIWNYYAGTSDISVTGGTGMMNCVTMNSYLRSLNSGAFTGDKTWPCGHIYNGLLDVTNGLGTLPAFGVTLNDSNVADWNNAQIYLSYDYYVTGDRTLSTWYPFNEDLWGSGITWYANGTQYPGGGIYPTVKQSLLYNMSSYGRVFLPAGNSLVNPATSLDAGYAAFNSSGALSSTTNCP